MPIVLPNMAQLMETEIIAEEKMADEYGLGKLIHICA